MSDPAQDRDEKTSLKTQEAGERAWALASGYAVEEQYIYRERHSAEEYYERPELTRLRADAKARRFAIVAVHSVERLARDPIHQGIIIEELERFGVKVHFVTEPIDDDSPDGQLVRFVRAYAAGLPKTSAKRNGCRALCGNALAWAKSYPARVHHTDTNRGRNDLPTGRLTKERLVPDPVTAPIVVRMFHEAVLGAPLRRIAAGLTRDGILTPSGRQRWDPTTVRYILTAPHYSGHGRSAPQQRIAR